MLESVCLSMILGNALGRSLSPSSNSSWCICFTDPCGSRRKPSADNRRWQDYTGQSREQSQGAGWEAAIHPEDLPGLLSKWEESRDCVADLCEARLRRFDRS